MTVISFVVVSIVEDGIVIGLVDLLVSVELVVGLFTVVSGTFVEMLGIVLEPEKEYKYFS